MEQNLLLLLLPNLQGNVKMYSNFRAMFLIFGHFFWEFAYYLEIFFAIFGAIWTGLIETIFHTYFPIEENKVVAQENDQKLSRK